MSTEFIQCPFEQEHGDPNEQELCPHCHHTGLIPLKDAVQGLLVTEAELAAYVGSTHGTIDALRDLLKEQENKLAQLNKAHDATKRHIVIILKRLDRIEKWMNQVKEF